MLLLVHIPIFHARSDHRPLGSTSNAPPPQTVIPMADLRYFLELLEMIVYVQNGKSAMTRE